MYPKKNIYTKYNFKILTSNICKHIYIHIHAYSVNNDVPSICIVSSLFQKWKQIFRRDFKTFLNRLYLKTSLSLIKCIIAHDSLHRYRTKTEGKSCWVQKSPENIPRVYLSWSQQGYTRTPLAHRSLGVIYAFLSIPLSPDCMWKLSSADVQLPLDMSS